MGTPRTVWVGIGRGEMLFLGESGSYARQSMGNIPTVWRR